MGLQRASRMFNFGGFIITVSGQRFEYHLLHFSFIILSEREENGAVKAMGQEMSFSQPHVPPESARSLTRKHSKWRGVFLRPEINFENGV